MDTHIGHVHYLVGEVDFVESQRERERGQGHYHGNIDLFCLEELLNVAAIAL